MPLKLNAVNDKIPRTARMASTGKPDDLPLHCFAVAVRETKEENQGKPKHKRTRHARTQWGRRRIWLKRKGKERKNVDKAKEEKQKEDKQEKLQRKGPCPKACRMRVKMVVLEGTPAFKTLQGNLLKCGAELKL